jgi:hypothetical protein
MGNIFWKGSISGLYRFRREMRALLSLSVVTAQGRPGVAPADRVERAAEADNPKMGSQKDE